MPGSEQNHIASTTAEVNPEAQTPTSIVEQGQQQTETVPSFDPQKEFEAIKLARTEAHALGTKEDKTAFRSGLQERIATFREKLLQQKETMAMLQNNLFESFKANPNQSIAEYLPRIQAAAPAGNFTPEQIKTVIMGLEKAQKQHGIVESYRALYPKDADLYRKLFGKKPKGPITITVAPLHLQVHGQIVSDYTTATNYEMKLRSKAKTFGKFETNSKDDDNKPIGGQIMTRTGINQLDGHVTFINGDNTFGTSATTKEIQRHEEQHIWNHLFATDETDPEESKKAAQVDANNTEAIKDFALGQLIERYTRERLRDEVLAQVTQSRTSLGERYSDVREVYLRGFVAHALYEDKRVLENEMREIIRRNFGDERANTARKLVPKEGLLHDKLNAVGPAMFELNNHMFRAIEMLQTALGSREKAIAMVANEPTYNWYPLAREIAEAKKQPTQPTQMQPNQQTVKHRRNIKKR